MLHMNVRFQNAIPIIETLERAGYEAVFVGGAVRDRLLARDIGDIDIATNAKPDVVQQLFAKTIPIGIEHGTVLVLYNDEAFEVTTYRIDGEYDDFRHPNQVVFVSDLEKDLARRDFTINAIAMTKTGDIIDPFHGQEDLHRKVIKTVHNPSDRFQEDPLRMMRALRFLSQLGFELDSNTEQAIIRNGSLLTEIAVERIAVEIEKLVLGKFVTKAFETITISKIYKYLPIFQEHEKLVREAKTYMKSPFLSMAEWITLLHQLDSSITIEQWCKSWKLSNVLRNKSKLLDSVYKCYKLNGLRKGCLYLLKEAYISEFVHLVNTMEQKKTLYDNEVFHAYQSLPITNRSELQLNGNDLLEMVPNLQEGPWIAQLLKAVEEEVVNGTLANKKEDIKEWVWEWIRENN